MHTCAAIYWGLVISFSEARIFLLVDLRERGGGGRQKNKKALSHFQRFLGNFFLISQEKNSKTSKVNQQSVLNL